MLYVGLDERDFVFELVELLQNITANSVNDREENNNSTIISGEHYIKNARYDLLFDRMLFDQSAAIFAQQSETIEAVLVLVYALLDRLPEDKIESYTRRLATLIATSESTTATPQLRLKLLVNLFNLVHLQHQQQSNDCKLDNISQPALIAALQYAFDSKQALQVSRYLRHIREWIPEHPDTDQAPVLKLAYLLSDQAHQAVAATASQHELFSRQQEGDEFLYAYIRSLEDAPNSLLSESIDQAVVAVRKAIIVPLGARAFSSSASSVSKPYPLDTQRLLSSSAVQQLGHGNQLQQNLFKLLQLINDSNVRQCVDFLKSNTTFITEQGFNPEQILSKVRTLALCRLGMQKDRLSYDDIKEQLGLHNDLDVDATVINAIHSNRLNAKIDEENRVVLVHRVVGVNLFTGSSDAAVSGATKRSIDVSSWQALSAKLETWRTNVHNVLNAMHQQHGVVSGVDEPSDDI